MAVIRRSLIWIVLVAAAAIAPAFAPDKGTAVRPNVLVVTIDTLRADRLSAYGYERKTSPNLDRLIERGVRFTQARTVEPLTGPALCSMITSRYPHEHGASRNGLRMRDGLDSLPKLLRDEGYRTAAFVGNWTLKDRVTGLGEHFGEYEAILKRKRWLGLISSEAIADDLTASAVEWITDHAESRDKRPFFLWVHYVEPHAPYRLQEQHLEALGLPKKGNHSPSDRYDTEIAEVDRSVGGLLTLLDTLELSDDTIVVFTSDHGESLGEHNYWGHGRHLYEPTLHVPMSITWNGKLAPRTIEAPALILDIAPTVANLVGAEPSDEFLGYDWSPALDGAAPQPVDRWTRHQAHKGVVLSDHDSALARRSGLLEVAIIQRGLKEISRVKGGKHWRFDLSKDPGEETNLVKFKSPPSEGLSTWTEVVSSGLDTLDNDIPEPLDEEAAKQLRALGYAD